MIDPSAFGAYDLSEIIPALVATIQNLAGLNWGASGRGGEPGAPAVEAWTFQHLKAMREELDALCRQYLAMEITDSNDNDVRTDVLAMARWHLIAPNFRVAVKPEEPLRRAR